jgi:pilus assembly protein Flp/PilA
LIRRLKASEAGATAIEYALIVGIMAVVIVGISATGGALDRMYDRVQQAVDAMAGGGGEEDPG